MNIRYYINFPSIFSPCMQAVLKATLLEYCFVSGVSKQETLLSTSKKPCGQDADVGPAEKAFIEILLLGKHHPKQVETCPLFIGSVFTHVQETIGIKFNQE